MIRERDCVAVDYIVFQSDAADAFRAGIRKSRRGRPADFDYAIFLVGIILAAQSESRTHLTTIHEVLTRQVPMEWQYKWGVRKKVVEGNRTKTWVLSLDNLEVVNRAITKQLNYSLERVPDRTEPGDMQADRDRRYANLYKFIDLMFDSTLIDRPEGGVDFALDATGIWAYERAPRALPTNPTPEPKDEDGSRSPVAGPTAEETTSEESASHRDADATDDAAESPAEPTIRYSWQKSRSQRSRTRGGPSDARMGVKTGKHRDEWFYGYYLHALVRAPAEVDGKNRRSESVLVERIRVTPASDDVVAPSLEMIDAVLSKGARIRYLLADRHYSYKSFDRWLTQLVKRDIKQIVTLRSDDIGFTMWDGHPVTASTPYCPAVPAHLGNILEPNKFTATDADWTLFNKSITEREAYAAYCTHPLNEKGESRWKCPALAGRIGCPLRAGTVQAANMLGLPTVGVPPAADEAPALCTQQSILLKATTHEQKKAMKLFMTVTWGKEKWARLANRRTFVEGWFGVLKNAVCAGKKRDSCNYIGLAGATLDLAAFAIKANLVMLRGWHRQTGLGDPNHPLLQPDDPNTAPVYLTDEEYAQYLEFLQMWEDQRAAA